MKNDISGKNSPSSHCFTPSHGSRGMGKRLTREMYCDRDAPRPRIDVAVFSIDNLRQGNEPETPAHPISPLIFYATGGYARPIDRHLVRLKAIYPLVGPRKLLIIPLAPVTPLSIPGLRSFRGFHIRTCIDRAELSRRLFSTGHVHVRNPKADITVARVEPYHLCFLGVHEMRERENRRCERLRSRAINSMQLSVASAIAITAAA
ncbi:hypothetical protein EVAR_49718_1 [Eumeta japonica]|uniref:Uncharacterized protein n=1 Tax=Eumeta variegata TaxID=151549 RepID=A0A4C1Z6X9_EUMVA|nr:hypothetical protein EVAR_49718_1 [Eumeta japonica]